MTDVDTLRRALDSLALRFAKGEMTREQFREAREEILSGVSPDQLRGLGVAGSGAGTPAPTAHAVFGPSGGRGKGVATGIASLSDLDLKPGAILFDQWRIERELGRGGFGVVVEAEELTLRERQAVKVLDPALVAREGLLERFRREVKATRKLVHPRIVRVFDYRESLHEGLALFSMEYVRGCSVQLLLAAAREKSGAVPVFLSLTILAQALEALEAAHEQGVIHRDITPANILLAGVSPEELLSDSDRDPNVKLVDFGIAGAVDRTELSQKSRVLGTAAYVAPEVLDPLAEITVAVDIYGAGAVFYELLTGEAPLGRFEDPSSLRQEVTEELDAFALSLLRRRPVHRPATNEARERALDLARASEEGKRRLRRKQEDRLREAGLREIGSEHPWYPKVVHPLQLAEAEMLGIPLAVEDVVTGMAMVLIPGGVFEMGASPGDDEAEADEHPRHPVVVKPFYAGVCPVLQEQWERVMAVNPSYFRRPTLPVNRVRLKDAQAFFALVNESRKERELRLPTEAEWERAARGGTETRYWWGNDFRTEMADSVEEDEDYRPWVNSPGKYPPNPFGLLDAPGTVVEFCADRYAAESYGKSASQDSAGPSSGQRVVVRGGSPYIYPQHLRVSNRDGSWPLDTDFAGNENGFRCVMDAGPL